MSGIEVTQALQEIRERASLAREALEGDSPYDVQKQLAKIAALAEDALTRAEPRA